MELVPKNGLKTALTSNFAVKRAKNAENHTFQAQSTPKNPCQATFEVLIPENPAT